MERLISRNPTDDCIAPKVRKVEMKTLLPEHLKSYLNAANTRDVLPMFCLELVSGLRKTVCPQPQWGGDALQAKDGDLGAADVHPAGRRRSADPETE